MILRICISAFLAGISIFTWEFISHMALPLGEAGLKALPQESATLAALKAHIPEPGFYFFPAPDAPPGASKEQQELAMRNQLEKMQTGPAGIMVIHPNGMPMLLPRQLAFQFAFDLAAMIVAAALLRAANLPGYGRRVLFVTALGMLPVLTVELPNWNWYGFPTVYMGAQAIVHVVGSFVGGLIVAAIIRPSRVSTAT